MNNGLILDLSLGLFLVLQTFLGWRRGFLWQAAGVASICFGMVLGWFLAPRLGEFFNEHVTSNPFHAKLTAFLLVAGTVGFILRMAAAWAEVRSENGVPKEERAKRRANDRILGGIFGAVKGSVMALVMISAAISLCPKSALWQQSKLATPFAVAGSRLLPDGAVSEMEHWARRSAADVRTGLNIN